jgi:hypothetical protein
MGETITSVPRAPASAASREPGAAPGRQVPRWEWPLVLALAVLAGASVLIATRHGVPITPDSVTYVAGARNLADGRGLTDFTGQALTNFPPGYPALLAIAELVDVSPWTFGRVVGAAIYAAIVVLGYLLVRRHVRATPFVIGATVLLACSTQMLIISGAISSDATFVALTLAFVLVLDHLRTTAHHRGLLIASAAGLVAVAFLVRYAAGALLLAGAISLLVMFVKEGLATAVRRTAAFVGLAVVVPVLWVVRNAASDNPDLLGFRVSSQTSIPGLLKGFVLGGARVIVPQELSNTRALALLLVGLVVVVMIVWPLRGRLVALARGNALALAPTVIVGLAIAAFLLWSERTVGADDMPRQFLPIWPLLIMLAAVFLTWVAESEGAPRGWRSTALNVLALVFVVGSTVWFAGKVVGGAPTYYDADGDADLRALVADVAPSDLIISNDPWRIYLHTDRQPVDLAPVPAVAGFSHRPMTADDVLADLCTRPGTLIWFDNSPATRALPVQELVGGSRFELTSTARFAGGEVYRVAPAGSAADAC